MIEPKTYSVPQAALVLGIGKGLLYRMINEKKIYAVKLGSKRVVIPRNIIDEMLQSVD